jgi:hypothetical protein
MHLATTGDKSLDELSLDRLAGLHAARLRRRPCRNAPASPASGSAARLSWRLLQFTCQLAAAAAAAAAAQNKCQPASKLTAN